MNPTQLPKLALSIRQPWAWLILHGGKNIENRTWPTKIRGRVWIHAASRKPERHLDAYFWAANRIDPPVLVRDLDFGGIIGSVEIVDCVTKHDSPWFFGPHGFVLANPQPTSFLPCRGSLGFFKPPF